MRGPNITSSSSSNNSSSSKLNINTTKANNRRPNS
jgi:hypothetical protein